MSRERIAQRGAPDGVGTHSYDPDQTPFGPRRQMLERVAHGARVLDVGCWSGFAGRFLVETRAAVVDGIEPDTEMASRASAVYRRVLPVTAEEAIGELASGGERYEAILFMDVLEHLADPGAILVAARELLAEGGRTLVSIPNVAHWSVRKELLLGRWRYAHSGILDRTHLRFYTLDGAQELLADAGYRVTWRDVTLAQPPIVRLPEQRLRLLRHWPRFFGVQGLFEAVPGDQVAG